MPQENRYKLQQQSARAKAHGNALFLILIAVILFAALAYAIIKSQNGNASTVTDEKLSIEFARQQQILTEAATAVHKAELNGCDSTTINAYDLMSGSPMPNDKRCAMFNVFGGPLTPQPRDADGSGGQGGLIFWDVSMAGIGTSRTDTLALLIFDRGEGNEAVGNSQPASSTKAFKICNYINAKLGISGYTPDFSDSVNDFYMYDTPLAGSDPGSANTTLPNSFNGKHEGCFLDNNNSRFIHYIVAIER